MFFQLSKIIAFLFSPLSWIVIVFILSFLLKKDSVKKRLRLSACIMLLFFTNPFLSNLAMSSWEISTYDGNSIINPYDVAIVMGGSTGMFDNNANRIVYSQSVDRLMQAVQLYRTHKVKKILLSGGSGFVTMPQLKESVFLKNTLLQMNIPEADIITETESRNTYENALHSSRLLKTMQHGSRFLLITSAIHMRRSLACFEKQGLTVKAFPVDKRSGFDVFTPDRIIIPNAWSLIQWEALIHEWVGFISYRISGYC